MTENNSEYSRKDMHKKDIRRGVVFVVIILGIISVINIITRVVSDQNHQEEIAVARNKIESRRSQLRIELNNVNQNDETQLKDLIVKYTSLNNDLLSITENANRDKDEALNDIKNNITELEKYVSIINDKKNQERISSQSNSTINNSNNISDNSIQNIDDLEKELDAKESYNEIMKMAYDRSNNGKMRQSILEDYPDRMKQNESWAALHSKELKDNEGLARKYLGVKWAYEKLYESAHGNMNTEVTVPEPLP